MFLGDVQLIKAMERTYEALQIEITANREAKELNIIETHVRQQVRDKLESMDKTSGKKSKKFIKV